MAIIRIVKMAFKKDEIRTFQHLFDDKKEFIRNFEGCTHLELWQDINNPAVFFTYSIWQTEGALNQYRESPFFKDTWQQTKLLFAAKPEIWTMGQRAVIP